MRVWCTPLTPDWTRSSGSMLELLSRVCLFIFACVPQAALRAARETVGELEGRLSTQASLLADAQHARDEAQLRLRAMQQVGGLWDSVGVSWCVLAASLYLRDHGCRCAGQVCLAQSGIQITVTQAHHEDMKHARLPACTACITDSAAHPPHLANFLNPALQAMVEQEEELLQAKALRATSLMHPPPSRPTSPAARTAMHKLASQLAIGAGAAVVDDAAHSAGHTTHSVGVRPAAHTPGTASAATGGYRTQPVPIIPPQRAPLGAASQPGPTRRAPHAPADSSDEEDGMDDKGGEADQGAWGPAAVGRPRGRPPPLPGSVARAAWQQAAAISRSPGSPSWSPPGSPGRPFTTMKQAVQQQQPPKKPDAVQAKLAALSAAYKQMKR